MYRKILMTVGVVATTLLASCDKKFDEINTNPNKPTEVSPNGLMTQFQRNIAYSYNDGWYGMRMKAIMSQQWTQNIYTDEDIYDFSARTGSVAGYFNYNYRQIEMLNEIIKLNKENPAGNSVYGDNDFQIASCGVLRCYLILQNVETFGDVPYTQANDLVNFPKPAYDKQEAIFKGIIEELKGYSATLATCSNGWVTGDILLDGDVAKWEKFANSLRLRTAMRLSNYDAAYSATEAKAAIADGVMESNDDSAVFEFAGIGSPNESPIFAFFKSRIDFTMTRQFVNLLQGENDDLIGFVNPFEGIVDPRLPIYALSDNEIAAGTDVMKIEGMAYGINTDDAATEWGKLTVAGDSIAVFNLKTNGTTDGDIPKPLKPDFWTTFLDYVNVALLEAELNGDAAKFEAGVAASMKEWGVASDAAAEYVAAVMEKFNAADAEKQREMILTQKYIHNFAHYSPEALHEVIRTGYPKSIIVNGDKTNEEYTFAPYNGEKVFIQRMFYPATEANFNRVNLDAAIASMGGDTQDLPLIYSKEYKK